jgi:hypothetical protein
VVLVAPPGGKVTGSATTVSASAADDVGVAGVQFTLDGEKLGDEVTTPPFAMSWNSGATNIGPHRLGAVARDGAGNVSTSVFVAVDVDNPPGGLIAFFNGEKVQMTWSLVPGAIGYEILRSRTSGGPYAVIATVTAPPYYDAMVVPGGKYYYIVRALSDGGIPTNGSAEAVVIIPLPPDGGTDDGGADDGGTTDSGILLQAP